MSLAPKLMAPRQPQAFNRRDLRSWRRPCRDCATGHGLGRGWVQWRAGAEPRLWVVELDQMVAGIDAGDEVCGGLVRPSMETGLRSTRGGDGECIVLLWVR